MQEECALFKALSDPLRLRLAALLATRGETCVCLLVEAVGEPEFKVSRHLGVMRSAGMVAVRRVGTWVHYSLAAPRFSLEQCLQECLRKRSKDDAETKADLKRLREAARKKGKAVCK